MAASAVPYRQLARVRHPEYLAPYWHECRALYSGGRKLLADRELMKRLFPPHRAEEKDVYEERLKRAFYIPYLGQIMDHMLAVLMSDPCRLKSDPEQTDPFYEMFPTDTSPIGGTRTTLNQLLRDQMLTALLTRRSWTLVDLPRSLPAVAPSSLADQEGAGLLRAYAVPLDPEDVLDWEEDDAGELQWVLCRRVRHRRVDLAASRDICRVEYVRYTPESWETYVVEYDETQRDKARHEPQDDDLIPVAEEGAHSFGRVPIVRLELPDGLWAAGKLHGLAVEHLNKRCALSWGQYKSLFQFLVAKLQAPDPMNAISEDQNRVVNQRVGHGRVMFLAEKDDLSYLSPDPAPYEIAMQDLKDLRDEMHRVLHHMAQAAEATGGERGRSGLSKQKDESATVIVLRALGQYAREHAEDLMEMIQLGRGDQLANWTAEGMDEFDEIGLSDLIADANILEGISIPSATFQRRWKLKLARKAMPEMSEEDLEKVETELDGSITQDQFDQVPRTDPPAVDENGNPIPPKDGAPPAKVKETGGGFDAE